MIGIMMILKSTYTQHGRWCGIGAEPHFTDFPHSRKIYKNGLDGTLP